MPGRRKKPSPEQQLQTLIKVINSGYIRGWSLAIDGGAHVGDWAEAMSRYFIRTLAFEPHPVNFAKMQERLAGNRRVEAFQKALFRGNGRARLVNPPKRQTLTATYIEPSLHVRS